MTNRIMRGLLGVALVLFSICQSDAANHSVSIQDFAFTPATLNIQQGDTVTWRNFDGIGHTVTSDTDAFDSGFLGQNDTFSHTFNTSGSFGYYCGPHSYMTGTIVVQAAGPTPPTVTITSPSNGTSYPSTTNVTIQATATPASGVITRVEFLSGTNLLGTVTNTPYRITTPFGPGSYSLTARATESTGAVGVSPAVTINVQGTGTPITNAFPQRIAKSDLTIELSLVADGMVSPLGAATPDDGSGRMFVYDQIGYIYVVQNGVKLPTPLLDIRSRMVTLSAGYDERGLLGVAVHPNFAANPYVYTYTSEPNNGPADFPITFAGTNNHQSVIAEWRIDLGNPNIINPASRREILRIDQPQSNHNGGAMHFGPDGFLYISLGDGGNADDEGNGHSPGGNGQDPNKVLGKILRIDVAGRSSANGKYAVPSDNPLVNKDGIDEIFALGFRNPYTFSFDRLTGELYVADVGQGEVEEVNRVFNGGNYGWPIKEGSFFFNPTGSGLPNTAPSRPVPHDLVDPIGQYDHDDGLAIVSGYVYRGTKIPGLAGRYVAGDWGSAFNNPSGRLYFLDRGEFKEFRIGLDNRSYGRFLKGFAQDSEGELYVFGTINTGPSGSSGTMHKIVAAPRDLICGVTRSGAQVNINMQGAVGPYVVQSKSDLGSPFWETATATNGNLASFAATENQQFFRLADGSGNPPVPFTVHLTGDQERPNPVNTAGTGSGILSLEGNTLHFNIAYTGLSSTAISAHIHGPSTVSSFGGILVDLGSYNGGRWGTEGVLFGSVTLTPQQKALLLDGKTYINIHSGNSTGGEIRGHIAPVVFATRLTGAAERPTPVQTAASGSGILLLAGNQLTLQVSYKDLSSTAISAHIHGPASASEFAGVLIDLAPIHNGSFATRGNFSGTVSLTTQQLGWLLENRLYINVHSSAHGGGEIRGQILPRSMAVPYTLVMNGEAERPTPVTTSGSGGGNMFLEGNRLHFELAYKGLGSAANAAHIHGFSDTAGFAGIQVDLGGFNNGAFGQIGAFSGQVTLSDLQRAQLASGKMYVNIHTVANGGGEIRGQITSSLLHAPLFGANVRPTAVQNTSGSARFLLIDRRLHVNASAVLTGSSAATATLSGPAEAHETAATLVNFGSFPTTGGIFGSALIIEPVSAALVDGLSYFTIQTTNRPAGEMRGTPVP